MEVVLAASAAANVAIVLIERFSNRETVTEEKQDVASEGTQALQELQTETEEVVTDPQVEETDAPEGSVRALEIRLKELRAQAKQLNSPDTFVQYARVSREANKVEKELLEKKAQDPNSADPLAALDISKLIGNLLPSSAKVTMKRKTRAMVLKMAVRVILIVSIWMYFTWYERSGMGGEVMGIDCRALRPFSMLLRKRENHCVEDDWVCAAQAPECIVSYTMILFVCNAVFSLVLQGFL